MINLATLIRSRNDPSSIWALFRNRRNWSKHYISCGQACTCKTCSPYLCISAANSAGDEFSNFCNPTSVFSALSLSSKVSTWREVIKPIIRFDLVDNLAKLSGNLVGQCWCSCLLHILPPWWRVPMYLILKSYHIRVHCWEEWYIGFDKICEAVSWGRPRDLIKIQCTIKTLSHNQQGGGILILKCYENRLYLTVMYKSILSPFPQSGVCFLKVGAGWWVGSNLLDEIRKAFFIYVSYICAYLKATFLQFEAVIAVKLAGQGTPP